MSWVQVDSFYTLSQQVEGFVYFLSFKYNLNIM